MSEKLTALSWGVGLQSTTLLEMSLSGDLPKLDVAIFADTGFEHQYSYEIFDFYAPRAIEAGIQVVKISGQDILTDNYNKVTLPLFIAGTDRMIKRKCTRDFKIRPIQREIRKTLGVNQRGRLAADLVDLWLGITTDEITRAKHSRVKYITHEWPLLDLKYKRGDCTEYLEAKGLPVPGKSSCKFCPYQKKSEWRKKTRLEVNLIADLQQHINNNGLVKISGQAKELSFIPYSSDLLADLSTENAPGDQLSSCDGGFCEF